MDKEYVKVELWKAKIVLGYLRELSGLFREIRDFQEKAYRVLPKEHPEKKEYKERYYYWMRRATQLRALIKTLKTR